MQHSFETLQIVFGRAGAQVSGGKNCTPRANQRKTLPIECVQRDQPMRCPNLLREPAFSRLVLFPWCVGAGDVMCRGAGRDVMWLSQNKYMLSIQK